MRTLLKIDKFLPIILGGLVCLAFISPASAQVEQLKKNSPFLPPGYNDPKPEVVQPKPQAAPGLISRELEFRGVVELGGTFQFSIFNKSEQRGYWIKENSTKEGINVRNFDMSEMSVLVQFNGRSETLNLMDSSDSPIPVNISSRQPPQQPVLPGPTAKPASEGTPSPPRRVIPRRRVILPRN